MGKGIEKPKSQRVAMTVDVLRAILEEKGISGKDADEILSNVKSRSAKRRRVFTAPTAEDYALATAIHKLDKISGKPLLAAFKEVGISGSAGKGALARLAYQILPHMDGIALQALFVKTNKKSENPVANYPVFSDEEITNADPLSLMDSSKSPHKGEEEVPAKPAKEEKTTKEAKAKPAKPAKPAKEAKPTKEAKAAKPAPEPEPEDDEDEEEDEKPAKPAKGGKKSKPAPEPEPEDDEDEDDDDGEDIEDDEDFDGEEDEDADDEDDDDEDEDDD